MGDAKAKAADNARLAYEEAQKVAEKDLAVTHPIRLGLALNFSVFQYEVLSNPDEACKMARTAFEDAIAELDNVATRHLSALNLIMSSSIVAEILAFRLESGLWGAEEHVEARKDRRRQTRRPIIFMIKLPVQCREKSG